ncbi:MAG TPA: TetR/AcrR family transcriptional regulator [Eubacteriaceae bacterium]|nr:TetR/AcrR family transcriptional regulator [Eubacteriaceae bacterium]
MEDRMKSEESPNKNKLRQSAIELMASYGYHATTTRMIAEKANLAVGTIYTNFKNKEGMLDYIFRLEYQKRVDYLNFLREKGFTSLEKLDRFLDFHLEELQNDKNLSKVLIYESTNPNLKHLESIKTFKTQLPEFFRDLLKEGIQRGEIRKVDAELTAQIIFYSIRGTIHEMAADHPHLSIGEVKDNLKDFIHHALKKE